MSESDKENSVECYKKFWFWSEQLKQKGNLENKDSIVVYSFRRFNEHTLSDLIERKITVCRPSKMNDPFDSPITLWGIEKYLNKICSHEGKDKYIPYFSKALNYFRIRSFIANRKTYEADIDYPITSFYGMIKKSCIVYVFYLLFMRTTSI